MQEIVPLILSRGDPVVVDTVPNWDRAPWLEETRACALSLDQRPSPRVFSTHFHYDMMSPSFFRVKPKVIYVMRNPKDVLISSFYYYGMSSFMGWLHPGGHQHIMYISYEEMIQTVRKIAQQCVFKNMKNNQMSNYTLVPSEIMDQNTSKFLRKGIVGDWKNHLTVAEGELFDAVYQNKMQH
ncbi:hypothetical protein CRUP_001614, partial [Coryphaenoides rupestris]